MTDYAKDTLNAYRSTRRAEEYRRFQTEGFGWGRFMTWVEQRAVARELARYEWGAADGLLDIPCGTGVLGKLLHKFPFKITASDISDEMMALARSEYPADRLVECVKTDITATGLPRASFACIVTLGFLHRVPPEIKRAALTELAALSTRVVLVSCSVDAPLQRFKHAVLSRVRPGHVPAPCPVPMEEMTRECEACGFRVARAFMVMPFLSAHALFVLEKRASVESPAPAKRV